MRISASLATTILLFLSSALVWSIPAAAQNDFGRQELPAEGLVGGDRSGQAVAIDGSYAAVGRRSEVHFYAWNGSSWYLDQVVTSGDVTYFTDLSFGRSVAISGNCALVGAESGGMHDHGEVYVLCRTGSGDEPWELVTTLVAPDGLPDARFGESVAIDGDYAVVGTSKGGASNDKWIESGSAYVYYRNQGGANNWGLQKKLNASDEDSGDDFGLSVAIHGTTILVGAPDKQKGAAYFFERDLGGTNNWGERQKVGPKSFGVPTAEFGRSVALGDGFAIISAPQEHAPGSDSGEIYAFKKSGTTWSEAGRIAGSDTDDVDEFGDRVAVDGNYVLAAARQWDGPGGAELYDQGKVYLFEWNGTSLTEIATLTGRESGFAWFGSSIDISNGKVIVGAQGDKVRGNDAGAAFAFIVVPELPSGFSASDGSSIQNINLSWEKSAGADGYRIYRDGGTSPIEEPTGLSYTDALSPGEVHAYEIVAYNGIAESPRASDIGRTRANGEIRGSVTSNLGTGVLGARVTATPDVNQSVAFDGIDDYIEVKHTDALNVSDGFLLQAWIKPDDVTGRHAIFSTRLHNTPAGFQLEVGDGGVAGGFGRLSVTSKNEWVYSTANGTIPAGVWTHVAFVRFTNNGSNFQLMYVNGEFVSGEKTATTFVDNDSPKLIGAGLSGGHFFEGQIDEVRLWDYHEIKLGHQLRNYTDRLTGNEIGLVGYWRLDPENGDLVADYANGSHGRLYNGAQFTATDPTPVRLSALTDIDGAYELRNIDYGEGTTYTVTPTLEGHGFDPPSRHDVYLAADAPSKSGINFTDTTALVVSGQIAFDIGGCPQPGVDILVNGVVTGTTDAEGKFSVTILSPGSVEITPSYGEHAFEPASVVYDALTASVEDVQFTNVETRTLDGRVVGGDCGLPLGDVSITLYGAGGCSLTREAQADAAGNYLITDLPALDSVTVEVIVEDDPLVTFAPRQVPLAAADTTADFIYRAPPQIVLTDWPEPMGSCGITVMEQLETYGIYVNVVEQYGDKLCPVTTGHVVFRNEIADAAEPDTVALTGEPSYYEFTAGEPNITGGGTRPYQKRIGIEAVTGGGPQAGPNGYSESLDQWVIVEGNRPRDKTFATVTPEIPLLILRDPPGDQSYSYVSKGSTMCTNMGVSTLRDDGSNTWGKVKLGKAFSVSGGVGVVSFGTEYAFWGEIGKSMETGSVTISQTETQVCHTATETFSTSDSELVTGSSGDVFVGGAMNFLYALTDVLEFDPATCQVKISQDVIFAPDKFATTYVYTEDYITGNLVPRLQGLVTNPNTPPDSAQFLQDQIEVWKQAIEMNNELKENAAFVENRSFSSGTSFESTSSGESTTSTAIEFNTYIDDEIAAEAGIEIGGAGLSGGYAARLRTETGTLVASSQTITNTVGYVLADDDPGDYFSVDILNDETYGTPVFQTVSGESSCLWEEGTRPRDAIQLQADAFVKSDVDPESAASFKITLSNPSQTETDQDRQYFVAPLQETNPDGATLRLNGDAFNSGLRFTVPTRSSVNAVLSVERGPEAFSYEDLKIIAYPECEYQAWQSGLPMQIADTLSVSVHFESACSSVTLSLPEDGWIVNAASDPIVQVLAEDFDPAALTNLKLQVSPVGKNTWTTVTLLTHSQLTDDQIVMEWDTSELPDGAYKLRLAVTCSEGTTYSAISNGTVDRQPPVVLGTPEPQDGIYHPGDEIAIEFNELLDCASFDVDDAILTAKETGAAVPAQVLCEERRIQLVPEETAAAFENATIQATILSVADLAGNTIGELANWTFRLNTNTVGWTSAKLAKNIVEGETTLLSATLSNTGATEEAFTLAGYPTWLTPDLTSGTLPSESSQAIVFSLDGSLARGTYRDTVIAQTARGNEPLFVEVSVQCPGPGWSFTEADAAQFAGSMHLVTGFYIDQIPFLGENDLVAAFVGDELRGLSKSVRVVPQDEYAVFLNVYGDTDGATVNFRVWDASECIERQVVGTRTFENGVAYGSASSLDSLSVSGAVLQEIALHDGWTWISLGVESTDMAVETVMQRVRPVDGNVIRGQSAYAQYVAGKGWIGTLSKLLPGVMYQILVDSAQALEFVGEPIIPNDRPLAVEEGWNWLGYLPDSPLPPATALASFEFAEGDLLRSQTQSSEFTASGWQGPLTTMNPGEGFLLRLESGGTLTYPGAQGEVQKTGGGVIAFAGKQGGPDWSIDTRTYEKVMTVTGTIQVDGLPLAGGNHVIGAFVDGEVRGLAKPIFAMDTWLYFVTVYSNTEGESVIFKVFDASQGKDVELAEAFKFQSTLALGSPREPIVFHTGPATGVGISANGEIPTEYDLSPNYPNPFNPTTQIRYAVKENTAVELRVYNILGQEVMLLVNEKQAPGWYTINFDGSNLASGVYFYRIQAGNFAKTHTMTLVK